MTVTWPDFEHLAKRKYSTRVWIPVYLMLGSETGEFPNIGWSESFEGVHSLVVSLGNRALGEKYEWSDDNEHRVWADSGFYKPADEYWHTDQDRTGFRLVIRQSFPDRKDEYHLHQDFVVALDLAREADVWVRPSEGYAEVARLARDANGVIKGVEIKAEYLADYLAARNAALRISSFRDQQAVVPLNEIPPSFDEGEKDWEDGHLEYRRMDISESGDEAGAGVAVVRVSRTDIDNEEDVPILRPETNENTDGQSWSFNRGKAVAARLMADFWRNEWFEPAPHSLRVRRDKVPSEVTFVTEADGQRASADVLNNEDVGKWLWFKPNVVGELAQRRGAELNWYSRKTGGISTPADRAVHFGLNDVGLVTVYAADVARLPEWERRYWAGFNVTPEGGVCSELLDAQVRVKILETQAPEKFLPIVISQFRNAWGQRFGSEIMKDHSEFSAIVKRCHRFRAVDQHGLFSLAKDLARISADLIDVKAARAECKDEKAKQYSSLKALECAFASICEPDFAHSIIGPLFATYDLRLQDAHPPKSDISRSYTTLGIDETQPLIFAGTQMLHMVVSSFDAMARTLNQHSETP